MHRVEYWVVVLTLMAVASTWWLGSTGFWGTGTLRIDMYVHPSERTTLYLALILYLAHETYQIIRRKK